MHMWCPYGIGRCSSIIHALIHLLTLSSIELWTELLFLILAAPAFNLRAYLWSICIVHRCALLMLLPITATAAALAAPAAAANAAVKSSG